MTVLKQKELREYISKWIFDYANENNRKSLTVCNYNDPSSALLLNLCKRVNLPLFVYTLKSGADEQYFTADAIKETDTHNGLLIGSVTKSMMLIRRYGKYTRGNADIFPLGSLYESEVRALLDDVEAPNGIDELQLTYDEIEWADRQNAQNQIITSGRRPQEYELWYSYTLRQKEVISRMHQLEKKTRHKQLKPLGICYLRNMDFVM